MSTRRLFVRLLNGLTTLCGLSLALAGGIALNGAAVLAVLMSIRGHIQRHPAHPDPVPASGRSQFGLDADDAEGTP